jgi:hypothetical protein
MYVTAPGGPAPRREGEATMADLGWTPKSMMGAVEWKLELEVENTREKLVHRARSLAERLTRLADGLEADPDFSFNTIGELQGNGVELDTWCVKLGFARETLKMFRQAKVDSEDES